VIGKGNKYGEIPVTNDLLLALITYRRYLKLNDYPNITENNIPLVCSYRRKSGRYTPISASMLYKLIKNTCSEVAQLVKITDPSAAFVIDQVSTHWLRHTSATHQVDAGIDIRVVKENLRHSMLETTMKYQHTEADSRHLETNIKFGIKKI
ncbi:MAG: tyrosine-type recombinase/integrase, partial [Burkholderiales bacterium]|nr:tyrosine-type recombinase/integrase [Burkholderiales bacterium]